jgi:hypothetical protein
VTEARLIQILKTILQINNPEVVRCTIESLIEELEDTRRQKKAKKE